MEGTRQQQIGIALAVVLLVALPTALHGWPVTVRGNAFTVLLLGGGLALVWWRHRPRPAAVMALGLFLAAMSLDGNGYWVPYTAFGLYSASFAVLALAWAGRAAYWAALGGAAYLALTYEVSGDRSLVATLMFTVPAFAAGTVLRLRDETSAELAVRADELDRERELFRQIALQHERARIASELHDIVGHAISVMVIQAAAGQRLVDKDPVRAKAAFAAISESASQGSRDLERLVQLLGGSAADDCVGADLSLVDEVVARAARSGLHITCRFEGDRMRVPGPVAHLAFRVVQESLTNALRYAAGADVRIVMSVDESDRGLVVRVENSEAVTHETAVAGTGRGLTGLRERIQALGGQFSAGSTRRGGWVVEAQLPGA
ncbi:MAG: sensor histidine kinase [Mycobacteriales bacterium]